MFDPLYTANKLYHILTWNICILVDPIGVIKSGESFNLFKTELPSRGKAANWIGKKIQSKYKTAK